jgi:hypothetical protein
MVRRRNGFDSSSIGHAAQSAAQSASNGIVSDPERIAL